MVLNQYLYNMVFCKTIFVLFVTAAASTMALNVASIDDCPALPDRDATAKDVTDLRIDDIKVIGGLGDRYCVNNCKH